MTRVCLVTSRYPPGVGGVAVSSHRLAGYLRDAGFLVHVVSAYPQDGGEPRIEPVEDDDGVSVHRVHFDAGRPDSLFYFRSFVRRLDSHEHFDLFHGFFLPSVAPCVTAATAPGTPRRPVVASIRGSDAAQMIRHPLMRRIIFGALRKATWLTSVNQRLLDEVAPLVGLADRCSVVRSGVPIEGPPDWQLDARTRGMVGTTGDFRPVKDLPLTIRGYAAVPRGLRRGLIVGGGFSHEQEERWSQTLIDEFGLRSETELTGRFAHAEVGALLRRMHVYVLSSAWEGMPNGLLEAAAHGVPLVATAVAGVEEIVEDGRSGVLVPHGDPAALGEALTRVLEDDDFARRLSSGARQMAERYSPDQERRAWLDLYERLLGATF